MKVTRFRLAEVESFPRPLEVGVLYFSERFSGAAHACACGCGMEVITPISPVQWITDGAVQWSADMTDDQIRAGRAYNSALREHYFKAKNAEQSLPAPQHSPPAHRRSLLARLINWLSRRLR